MQVYVYVDGPMAVGSMLMFQAHDSSKCKNDVPGLDCHLRHCAELALALTWARISLALTLKPGVQISRPQKYDHGRADPTPRLPWGGLDEGETTLSSPWLPLKVRELGWSQGPERGSAGPNPQLLGRADLVPCLDSITKLTLLAGV